MERGTEDLAAGRGVGVRRVGADADGSSLCDRADPARESW
ncbi:hypothetical protein KCH_40680 [Kitasatospora cheerisanensis KCTC 2395]|uniref:Uncharacterized protein n=1 Tax=Kitasatospora cheerisanensis KCTC 2395 TaxID=1348663 RepID=A0A066YST5_9ACTN|nr:hypothetical protein KCH_40680 [Kitasatospora cheerisanensis KCTC 2395]